MSDRPWWNGGALAGQNALRTQLEKRCLVARDSAAGCTSRGAPIVLRCSRVLSGHRCQGRVARRVHNRNGACAPGNEEMREQRCNSRSARKARTRKVPTACLGAPVPQIVHGTRAATGLWQKRTQCKCPTSPRRAVAPCFSGWPLVTLRSSRERQRDYFLLAPLSDRQAHSALNASRTVKHRRLTLYMQCEYRRTGQKLCRVALQSPASQRRRTTAERHLAASCRARMRASSFTTQVRCEVPTVL